jgi:hypothetical protein
VVVCSPLDAFKWGQWPPEFAIVARTMFLVDKKSKNEQDTGSISWRPSLGCLAQYDVCSIGFYVELDWHGRAGSCLCVPSKWTSTLDGYGATSKQAKVLKERHPGSCGTGLLLVHVEMYIISTDTEGLLECVRHQTHWLYKFSTVVEYP